MDPYAHSTVWLKVENRAYTQMEGRGELFHPKPRQASLRQHAAGVAIVDSRGTAS